MELRTTESNIWTVSAVACKHRCRRSNWWR